MCIRFFLVLIAISRFVATASGATDVLTIHCMNVGHGDCTLIQSRSGKTFLIDSGPNGAGAAAVVPYLQNLGIVSLTYVGVSHYDTDHMSGLDEVLDTSGVDSVCFDRGWSCTTPSYSDYVYALSANGIPRRAVGDGDVIDLGDGVRVCCVCVNGNGLLSPPFDCTHHMENDLSIGYLVEVGAFQFFVGGDLSGSNDGGYHDIESSVATEIGEIEVLRVNGHGGTYSSNETFLSGLSPAAAIISVGDGNGYGLPSQTIIDRIVSVGAYIYQTETGTGGSIPTGYGEIAGDIVIRTDGICTFVIEDSVYLMDWVTTVAVPESAPPRSVLLPNVPNPFNPMTTIRFETAVRGPVHLSVYDLRGRHIRRLRDAVLESGFHAAIWNGQSDDGWDVPSGLYFARLIAPDRTVTRKILLSR